MVHHAHRPLLPGFWLSARARSGRELGSIRPPLPPPTAQKTCAGILFLSSRPSCQTSSKRREREPCPTRRNFHARIGDWAARRNAWCDGFAADVQVLLPVPPPHPPCLSSAADFCRLLPRTSENCQHQNPLPDLKVWPPAARASFKSRRSSDMEKSDLPGTMGVLSCDSEGQPSHAEDPCLLPEEL